MTASTSGSVPTGPGLQDVSALAPVSPAAAVLAVDVLRGELGIAEAYERVADCIGQDPRVDGVVAALTTFAPDDPTGWLHLGQRAWLREWVRTGSPCTCLPPEGAGPEAALTMPWMSALLRRGVVAAIPDAHDLPGAAEQDQRELAQCHIRSLVSSAQQANGTMYGGLSVMSSAAGPWPETVVADLRLLGAALTSRMAAEQAQRSLADAIAVGDQARTSQQQFFATVGHELRTPISAIVGFAEVLVDEAVDLTSVPIDDPAARLTDFGKGVERDAGIILRAGDQLLEIVEDLLSTGRVLGSEEPRGVVPIADAVKDVVHWVRTPARTAQVTIDSDLEPDLSVWATSASLRQILTNLLSNAVVHNHVGGSVVVSAARSLGESGEPRIRISVRDSGPGLTAERQQQVFEPFVRFAAPGVRGTGLGLPLSRAIAERHGGTLGVESVPDHGSTFWVELPSGEAGDAGR